MKIQVPRTAKPSIKIAEGTLPEMIATASDALGRSAQIFQREGRLVSISNRPDKYENGEACGGNIVIEQFDIPRLRALMAGSIEWLKWQRPRGDDPGEWRPADPDEKTVASVLSGGPGCWRRIRPLRGIANTPFMAEDGTIVTQNGYHAATGYVLDSSIQLPPIPIRPTQQQAHDALKFLWIECFGDFPYAGLGEARGMRDDRVADARFEKAKSCPGAFVGIGGMLTILARPAIRGAVMSILFQANTQGAGKTKQAQIVSLVTTGREVGATAWRVDREGKPDDAEIDKSLASYAAAGDPMVLFDNVKGELTGGPLEAVMTSDRYRSRLLGTNNITDMPWTALLMFSGNNMRMSDDMCQRAIESVLSSPRDRPRDRPANEFRHPNLFYWIRTHRSEVVAACLTILRAAAVNGATDTKAIGSFEEWSRVVGGSISFAGGPCILECTPNPIANTDDAAAHLDIMRHWPKEFEEGGKLVAIVRKAFENEKEIEKGAREPDGLEDLRAAMRDLCGTKDTQTPSVHALAQKFRSVKGKWREGMKLDTIIDRTNVMLWRVVKREEPKSPDLSEPIIEQPKLEPEVMGVDPAEEWDRSEQ